MTEIIDGTTIGATFATAVAAYGKRPFLAVPANADRNYLSAGIEITYRGAAVSVEDLAAVHQAAGYCIGHRIAALLENRSDYALNKLALNSIGV